MRAERVAQPRAQDIGERHRPDHGIGDAEIFGQHVRAGHQSMDQEGAEQNGHGGAAGHAEGDRRNQRTAFLGVVGAFRGDHAAHVPLAERGACAFLGLQGVAVGEPVDHRGADAGNRADAAADPGAAHDQPPVAQTILHALPLAFVDVGSARVRRNGDPRDKEIAELRQREDAEEERGERQAIPEIKAVEGPPQRAGLRVGSDHRDHHAEASRDNAAQRRIA